MLKFYTINFVYWKIIEFLKHGNSDFKKKNAYKNQEDFSQHQNLYLKLV